MESEYKPLSPITVKQLLDVHYFFQEKSKNNEHLKLEGDEWRDWHKKVCIEYDLKQAEDNNHYDDYTTILKALKEKEMLDDSNIKLIGDLKESFNYQTNDKNFISKLIETFSNLQNNFKSR